MIFTTHLYMPNGTKWSGPRIKAISWNEAEYIASTKGVEITGRLCVEIDEETGVVVNYDLELCN